MTTLLLDTHPRNGNASAMPDVVSWRAFQCGAGSAGKDGATVPQSTDVPAGESPSHHNTDSCGQGPAQRSYNMSACVSVKLME